MNTKIKTLISAPSRKLPQLGHRGHKTKKYAHLILGVFLPKKRTHLSSLSHPLISFFESYWLEKEKNLLTTQGEEP